MFRLLTRQAPKKENIKKLVSTEHMSQFSSLIQHVHEKDQAIQLQMYDSNIVDIGTYVKVCRMYGTFCHCVIILFNVRSKRSYFNAINKWLPMIRKRNPNLPVFLVANKCDNFQKRFSRGGSNNLNGTEPTSPELKRDVSGEEAQEMATEKNIIYREVSAQTGEGIDELCADVINTIYTKVVQVIPKEVLDEAHETCERLLDQYNVVFRQRVIELPKFTPSLEDNDYYEKFTESEMSDGGQDEYDEYAQESNDKDIDVAKHTDLEYEEEYGTNIFTAKLTETKKEKELKGIVNTVKKYKENQAVQQADDDSDESLSDNEDDDEKMKQIVEKSFAEADQEIPYFRINNSTSHDNRTTKYYANSSALVAGLTEDNIKEIKEVMEKNNISVEALGLNHLEETSETTATGGDPSNKKEKCTIQ